MIVYWLVFQEAENLCFTSCSPETGIHLKSLQLVNRKMQVQSKHSIAPNLASQHWQTSAETPPSPVDGLWQTLELLKTAFCFNKPSSLVA